MIDDFIEKLMSANSIAIYGAGEYARCLIAFLKLCNKEDKIIGLTTTDTTTNNEKKYGFPLLTFENVVEQQPELLVVAISPENATGIRKVDDERLLNMFFMTKESYHVLRDEFKKLPIKSNKLFVDCYDGMGYRCNCKYVCKYILENKLPIEIVWKVRKKYSNDLPPEIRKVYADDPEYYAELFTSKCILTNVVLSKVRNDQYAIWTWHGTGPFKKAGAAAFERNNANEKMFREIYSGIDLFISNSHDNSKMYREDFYYNGEIAEWGYPRNDLFFTKKNNVNAIRNRLGIPEKKAIVLYVPTFRERIDNSFRHYDIDVEKILDALKRRFNKEFVFVYRFHHLLRNDKRCNEFYIKGINATDYEDTQELLLLADVLITDYSSVMWDFSLMRKPVFLYQNDVLEYCNERGFYWPPEEWGYPIAHSNTEMENNIIMFDETIYGEKLEDFFKRDPSYDDGGATERVVNRLLKVMQ